MGYRYELQGRVKFSVEKLVYALWILKWPFIDELAWKGPNCPDEKLFSTHVVLSVLIG